MNVILKSSLSKAAAVVLFFLLHREFCGKDEETVPYEWECERREGRSTWASELRRSWLWKSLANSLSQSFSPLVRVISPLGVPRRLKTGCLSKDKEAHFRKWTTERPPFWDFRCLYYVFIVPMLFGLFEKSRGTSRVQFRWRRSEIELVSERRAYFWNFRSKRSFFLNL